MTAAEIEALAAPPQQLLAHACLLLDNVIVLQTELAAALNHPRKLKAPSK